MTNRPRRARPSARAASTSAHALRAPGHPIQVVMRRTGLSADVIRAWEKRYGVVTPGRSATGRRLYADADVERLRLLARATLTGRTIGQVATLSNAALAALATEDAATRDATTGAAPADTGGPARPHAVALEHTSPPLRGHLGAGLAAVERLDPTGLDAVLRRAAIALSADMFLDALVVPLWSEVTERERAGGLRPAHRHLTLAVLRRVLDRITETATIPAAAPDLIVTTLPGFAHASQELGALLASATAAADGWRVLVAPPALPAEEAADLAQALGVRAVIVSLGAAPSDRALPRELRRLRTLLPSGVAILLAGAAALAHPALAREIGAAAVHDLPALRARLDALWRAASAPPDQPAQQGA